MWPLSDEFLATNVRTHSRQYYLEILKDGRTVSTLQGGVIYDTDLTHTGHPGTVVPQAMSSAQLLGGTVTADKTTIRRSGTVSFLDVFGQLMPYDVDDLFAPYVTEIRLWHGVRYWNAPIADISTGPGLSTPSLSTEFIPIGTLVITDVDNQYPQINLTCYDRMWILGQFTAPYSQPRGVNLDVAISTLLSKNVPPSRLSINLPTTDEVTTTMFFDVESQVADAVFALANLAGWDAYVDPIGTFTAMPTPSTDDEPVMTYQPGEFSALMRPQRTIGGGAELYNAVVFTGEGGATSPVRGYAQDDNPLSLTYVARIGVRPYFASSPLITTTDQANLAARTRLSNILGTADTLVVPVIPNPAIEIGDVIHVIDPAQNLDQNVIVDSFTISLKASDGAQQLTCRSQVIR